MEESEKRKERLRAIRLKASQADISCNPGTYDAPGGLSNPLAESSTAQVACSAPRFDFYTDPIAAFSANKRSSHQSSQDNFASYSKNNSSMVQLPSSPSGPWNPGSVPLVVQNDFVPDLRFHQAGDLCRSPDLPLNPMGMTTTGPVHQIASPSALYMNRAIPPLSPMGMTNTYPMYQTASPGAPYLNRATPPRSFVGMTSPYPVHQIASPGAPYPTRGSPSFGSPQGRGNWYISSARPGSGWGRSHSPNEQRGSGLWSGSSTATGSGHSGGRGRAYHDVPVRGLYNKLMLENPWKDLKPVIWRGVNGAGRISKLKTHESDQKPASTKMPRVFDSSNASSLKQSLADYLAAAFDEAVEDVNSV